MFHVPITVNLLLGYISHSWDCCNFHGHYSWVFHHGWLDAIQKRFCVWHCSPAPPGDHKSDKAMSFPSFRCKHPLVQPLLLYHFTISQDTACICSRVFTATSFVIEKTKPGNSGRLYKCLKDKNTLSVLL